MKLATLAIIVRGDKVLLGEKKRGEIGSGTLNGPGGKLDPGETLEECVVRETREELGIELNPLRLDKLGVITFFAHEVPDFQVHLYRTEHFTGEIHETDDMIPGWYPIDSLPFDRMLESDRAWFARAARGEHFDAEVYYDDRAKGFREIRFI